MKRNIIPNLSKAILLFVFSGTSFPALAQEQHSVHSIHLNFSDMNTWFGLLELPFLFICMYYAFKTATSLKGGVFGKAMSLMAWGFLVMGVGHLHMQIEHFMGINIFKQLFGETAGSIIWFIALITTWLLSGMGFYSIYNTSKKS